MTDTRLSTFGGTASILVGVGLVAFIVLGASGLEGLRHGVVAVVSLVAFPVVITVGLSVAGGHPGWTLWASSLGLFGLALSAIVETSLLFGVDRQQLLPQFILVIATFAAWVLITSLVALVIPDWRATWSWVGVVLSLLSAGLIPAQLLGARTVAMALGGAGTILAVVWFIWTGMILRGAAEASDTGYQPDGRSSE